MLKKSLATGNRCHSRMRRDRCYGRLLPTTIVERESIAIHIGPRENTGVALRTLSVDAYKLKVPQ